MWPHPFQHVFLGEVGELCSNEQNIHLHKPLNEDWQQHGSKVCDTPTPLDLATKDVNIIIIGVKTIPCYFACSACPKRAETNCKLLTEIWQLQTKSILVRITADGKQWYRTTLKYGPIRLQQNLSFATCSTPRPLLEQICSTTVKMRVTLKVP